MGSLKNFFATRWGIIGVGAFIGVSWYLKT